MTSLTKKLAVGTAAISILTASSMPAFAFDPQEDANLMAYWTMDLGPKAQDEDRSTFGFAANKSLGMGKAGLAYDIRSNYDGDRPAFVDIQFNGSGSLDTFSLNGTNVLNKYERLNADGSSSVVFGLQWWQIALGVVAIGTAGYLIVDALDDDDDDASGDGGGGGTTGTPLDAVLDPLAGAAGGGGAPALPLP